MSKNSSLRPAPLGLLETILEHGATVCLILFFVSVVLQVLFRYVLEAPLTWSEEAARYLNLWSVALGAALAVARREHLRVNVIDRLLAGGPRLLYTSVHCFGLVVTLVFSIIVFIGAVYMTIDRWTVSLTVLPVRQGFIYLALAVSFSIIITSLAIQLVAVWRTGYRERSRLK